MTRLRTLAVTVAFAAAVAGCGGAVSDVGELLAPPVAPVGQTGDDMIAELAARVAWSNQTAADQDIVCDGFHANPVYARDSFLAGAGDDEQGRLMWEHLRAILAEEC